MLFKYKTNSITYKSLTLTANIEVYVDSNSFKVIDVYISGVPQIGSIVDFIRDWSKDDLAKVDGQSKLRMSYLDYLMEVGGED